MSDLHRSPRLSRFDPLGRIGALAARRSRLVICVWIAVIGVLAVIGRNLEHELTIHPAYIDGTGSKRAHEISLHEFGGEYAMIVMLRGPTGAVEREGRQLASRLGAMPGTLVVSPWAGGANVQGLRPEPGVAALVVRVESSESEGVLNILPPIRRQVDVSVTKPVTARVAGFPVVIDSLRKAGQEATTIGELIAVPVLLVVLLLVFRSVFAALIPIVAGGAVVAATRGVLSILFGFVEIDLFAVSVIGMMGLALGVDYSLLVVSRFRELRDESDLPTAVETTVRATAGSVIPAGGGLLLAMLVAYVLMPGAIAHSVSIAVMSATVLSMLSSICIVPAFLAVLGDNLDRWALPRREASAVAPLRWSRRLSRQPRAVVGIMIALVFLAGWAFTLNSAATSIKLLPSGDAGRRQQEEVADALGPGWVTPMEVIMNGRGSPVTSASRLRALAAFQRKVEDDPGVETMAGFAQVERGARQLNGIEGQLADQERGLDRLGNGLAKLGKGARLNTSGLLEAANGSSQLDTGLGAANAGAGVIASSLRLTSNGSERLVKGLGRADGGSDRLAEGTSRAGAGAGRLTEALERAQEKTGEIQGSARLFKKAMRSGEERLDEASVPLQGTEEQLAAAWQALQQMTAGRADPEYAAVLQAIEKADRNLTGEDIGGAESGSSSTAVADSLKRAEGQFGVGLYLAARLDKSGRQASKGMKKLARGSAQLDQGLGRLADGSRRLSTGIAKLARGGEQLSPALAKLSEGAGHLAGGLGQLETGSGLLASGLGAGAEKSKLLSGGLERASSGLEGGNDGSGITGLRQRSPGLFHSAYFVLAGLDGSRPGRRTQLGFLINLDRGGRDARMLIVPRDDAVSAAAEDTMERLKADAEGLARKTGTEVVLGGVGPDEMDLNNAIREGAPLLRLALSLVSLLILIPVLRSLTIPVLAALINLITVSASFGVLSILFNSSLLGGPGYVDTGVILGMMVVMFGLAIDYEVFVFARIREEYVRTGSTSAAVSEGLDRTAHVVTGAATIMIAVFLAFSVSPFMTIRNFGVGQAVAVAIDAFVIRLVVIPAMMSWLGKWCWWMPRWLDHLLPGNSRVNVAEEGEGTG